MLDIKVEQTQGPETCPRVRVSAGLLQMAFHPQEQRPSWLTQPWTCLSCCSWNSGDGCVQRVCRKFQKNLETCWAYRHTHTHTHTRTFSLGFISSDIYKKPRILNTLVPWILATNTRAPSPGQRAWASVSNTPHSVYVSEPTSWGWREITLQGGAVTITRIHYLLERTLLF